MADSISYTFRTNKGSRYTMDFPTIERALYMASSHHERGYFVESMKNGNARYNHDEILRLCHKYQLL